MDIIKGKITGEVARKICKKLHLDSASSNCTVTVAENQNYQFLEARAEGRAVQLRLHDGGGFEIITISHDGTRTSFLPLENGRILITKAKYACDGKALGLIDIRKVKVRHDEIEKIYAKRAVLALAQRHAYAMTESSAHASNFFFSPSETKDFLFIFGIEAENLCKRLDFSIDPLIRPYLAYRKNPDSHQITLQSDNASLLYRWFNDNRIEIIQTKQKTGHHLIIAPDSQFEAWKYNISPNGDKTKSPLTPNYAPQDMRKECEELGRFLLRILRLPAPKQG